MSWQQWRERWQQRWLDKRIPPARRQVLGQRALFILPTRFGLLFGVAALATYILGTNYQNNLVLLLAYAQASLLVASMWLTHRNLQGLQLLGGPLALGDTGGAVPLTITLTRAQACRALDLTLSGCQLHLPLVDEAPQTLTLPVTGHRRGRLPLPRLRVESRYPLGLFRCWSLVDLQLEAWLAPAPRHGALRDSSDSGQQAEQGRGEVAASMGDFAMLRLHQPGDPLGRIAWKQLAQGRGLLVKTFSEPRHEQTRLSLQRATGQDLEQRLAVLAWWSADYAKRGVPFTLELSGVAIGPDSGPSFLQRCRMALARYGTSP